MDIETAKAIFSAPEPKIAEQWLCFLSDEQIELVDTILSLVEESEDFKVHFVLGGAGTGKTQVLLMLASDLSERGIKVAYYTSLGVRKMIERAGLDLPTARATQGSVHLVDDPNEPTDIIRALEMARVTKARALVVAVDPFQWTERTAFLQLSLMLGERQIVGDLSSNRVQGIWETFSRQPVTHHFLRTAYRQSRITGLGSLELTKRIFERMNPYIDSFKRSRFDRVTQPFVQNLLGELVHVSEGGSFLVNDFQGPSALGAALAKIANRQDHWDWSEPILFVEDDNQRNQRLVDVGFDASRFQRLMHLGEDALVADALESLNARVVQYRNSTQVRGQEFQDVIIAISAPRWNQLGRHKQGMDSWSWQKSMPIHTFTTRAIDSVQIVVF